MGERIATLLPDGNEINYHYGPSGGFTALRYNAQLITQIERNSLGQEQQRHQGALTTHSDYDPQGRLIKQQAQHQQGSPYEVKRNAGVSILGTTPTATSPKSYRPTLKHAVPSPALRKKSSTNTTSWVNAAPPCYSMVTRLVAAIT